MSRSSFKPVTDLIAAITLFIDSGNTDGQLFTWTKTGDEIGPHATRSRGTSFTRRELAYSFFRIVPDVILPNLICRYATVGRSVSIRR